METRLTTDVSPERLKVLPRLPGIYLMKDERGKVLYVGKAKNLRARVRSYFNFTDSRRSVRFIVEKARSVETIVTTDEREALILENDLIKKYKPRYNVRLKDDKGHLIVRIDLSHEWPRLDLVRQVREDGARYIGPFAFGHELRSLLDTVKQSVPLRTCSDKTIYNRVRPCLEYQIKRCAGPCCLPVDKDQYSAWVKQAVAILEGKDVEVAGQLSLEMERASAELRFEDAAAIRDRLAVLKTVRQERTSVNYGAKSKDIFGIYREGDAAELVVLAVRDRRLFGSVTYGFAEVEVSDSDLLSTLISQYYEGSTDIPDEILLPMVLEDRSTRMELYSEKKGRKVSLIVPSRGQKLQLLRLAESNAKENFMARPGAARRSEVAIQALQFEFGFAEVPRIIECVDVSHFQGSETVASVVCFKDGEPERSRYRCFKLSQEGKPDDFASMREVVRRHLSRCAEENTLADLIVIDGGPAQLSQALLMRKELSLSGPPIISLAKKRSISSPYRRGGESGTRHKPERVYLEDQSLPVVLKPTSEALQLLERLRDEAHRFAISFHRKSRTKRIFRSELDKIPGIGHSRRQALLKEFGSVAKIRTATAEELATRCKIPESLAKRIIDLLNRGSGQP